LPIDRGDGIKSAARDAIVRRDMMCVGKRQCKLDESDLREVSRLSPGGRARVA
jgi:hypothetical protein